MLRYLRVRNFALIDQLELHFEEGFNLLSGETGAGKSIIVDALALLCGAKASAEMVRTGETRSIIEAVFECDVKLHLDRLGFDSEAPEIVIRREISSDERNRVYVNNQPGTVTALRELAPLLIDIHGQHEQQTLLDVSHQLELIDVYAEAKTIGQKVREVYSAMQQAERELSELSAEHVMKKERYDLLAFQHDEIQKVNPKPGETDALRERVYVQAHAGKLLEAATRGHETLYDSETSVLAMLSQTQRQLRDAAQHDQSLQPIVDQTDSVRVAIQDLAYALRRYLSQVQLDPRELERNQARLSELERLHRKYGPDLLEHLKTVRRELDSIGLTESRKDLLEQQIGLLKQTYAEAAQALSKVRRTATKGLEDAIERELRSLAMPQVRFVIKWFDVSPGRSSGIDRPELLISPNMGEELKPLEKIASGGELSRIMLALRTVLAVDSSRKTLVFDEVDSGVGGKGAEKIGQKLKEISSRYQVFCVTHLAQVAAFADHQYRIEKLAIDNRSVTRVEKLEGESRIEELVRMMSGSHVTESARKHVKELLKAVKA